MIISKEEFLKACNEKIAQDNYSNKLENEIRKGYEKEQNEISKKLEELYARQDKLLNASYGYDDYFMRGSNVGYYQDRSNRNQKEINLIESKILDLEMQLEGSRESMNYELEANKGYYNFTKGSINEQLNIK